MEIINIFDDLPIITNKIYTGVGSRETPHVYCKEMMKYGYYLAKCGCILRSGRAPGADYSFEYGCNKFGGKKEIYLPSERFQHVIANPEFGYYLYNRKLENKLIDLVYKFHPNPKRLSEFAFKLMMRNCHQILGYNLDSPTDFIIMWSPKIYYNKNNKIKDCQGGTGFAVRLGYYFNIPIFDITKLIKFY